MEAQTTSNRSPIRFANTEMLCMLGWSGARMDRAGSGVVPSEVTTVALPETLRNGTESKAAMETG